MAKAKKKSQQGGYSGTKRKQGTPIPVGHTEAQREEWRRRVVAKLIEKKWRTEGDTGTEGGAEWWREAKAKGATVSRSAIFRLMTGSLKSCVDLAILHQVLGWDTHPPLLSVDEEEMLRDFRVLNEREQMIRLGETRERVRKRFGGS